MVEAMGSFWVDVVEGKVGREGGREGKEEGRKRRGEREDREDMIYQGGVWLGSNFPLLLYLTHPPFLPPSLPPSPTPFSGLCQTTRVAWRHASSCLEPLV